MAYVVFLLGLMLSGCGGYVLYLGFDDLTTERGLALTMSGTVAFSVGVVVLAIGFAILKLGSIGRKLDGLRDVRDLALAPGPSIEADAMAPIDDDRPLAGLPKRAELSKASTADETMLDAVEDAIFAAGGAQARNGHAGNVEGLQRAGASPPSPLVEHDAGAMQAASVEPASGSRFSFKRAAPAAAAIGTTAAAAAALSRGSDRHAERSEADAQTEEDDALHADPEAGTHVTRPHDSITPDPTPHDDLASPAAAVEGSSSAQQSRLSDTHAEIDRLIEELAADNAAARSTSDSRALEPAEIVQQMPPPEILPPEPDIYRMSAFEEVMMEEMTIDELDSHASAPDRADEAAAAASPATQDGATAGDLAHLEPVRDEVPKPDQHATAEIRWLEPERETTVPDRPVDHDAVHLEPVAADHESSVLREATHHVDADEADEVIGSYESAGVTYTLHADGSVIAEAGETRETYPSLEALRGAFERGESAFSV